MPVPARKGADPKMEGFRRPLKRSRPGSGVPQNPLAIEANIPATDEPMLTYRTNPIIEIKDAIIAYSIAVAAEGSARRDAPIGGNGFGLGIAPAWRHRP